MKTTLNAMRRALLYFRSLDRRIAWNALQNMLIACGGIGIVSIVSALGIIIGTGAALALAALWFVMYKLQEGIERRAAIRRWQKSVNT